MPLQLSPEQEQRIRSVVERGAYGTAEEAIDAAVSAVEAAASQEFDGSTTELEALVQAGLDSGEPITVDDGYWAGLEARTDRMLADYLRQKR